MTCPRRRWHRYLDGLAKLLVRGVEFCVRGLEFVVLLVEDG
jgi:hypothetical protein